MPVGRPWPPLRLLVASYRSLLHHSRDPVGSPPRQGENRPGGILVGLRDKRSSVGDEQILAVMGLTIGVHGGTCRIAAHANAAGLVDDRSAVGDSVATFLRRHRCEHFATHFGD